MVVKCIVWYPFCYTYYREVKKPNMREAQRAMMPMEEGQIRRVEPGRKVGGYCRNRSPASHNRRPTGRSQAASYLRHKACSDELMRVSYESECFRSIGEFV